MKYFLMYKHIMFRVIKCLNGCKWHNGCMGCVNVQCKYDYEYDGYEYCADCYSKIKPEIEKIEELQQITEEKLKS